jgi:hypothetical protein
MNEMLARFEACLDEWTITAQVGHVTTALPGVQPAVAQLARSASAQVYTLLCGPAVTFKDAAGVTSAHPTLVFTTFVAPRTAEAFRRAGVQYLDTAGNAWITFGDVLLDVRGRSRPDHAAIGTRAAGNLFSTRRAQVVFALLAWPHLWNAPQRDVAHAAGVSVGQAHNTLALLTEAGYGRDSVRAGLPELLDLWAAAFLTGLAQKLTLATYRGDIEGVKKVSAEDPVFFVSGESAADDLLRPASLTLYVEKLDPRLPIVNKWRADGEPNIVVRRTFWRAPDNSDAPLAALRTAPWPLVYADLRASDNPRVRGVAAEWRARLAQPA